MKWFKSFKDKNNKTDQEAIDKPVAIDKPASEDKPVDTEQAKDNKAKDNKPVDGNTSHESKSEYGTVATGDYDAVDSGQQAPAGGDADNRNTAGDHVDTGISPSVITDKNDTPQSKENPAQPSGLDNKTTTMAMRRANGVRNGILLFVAIAFVLNVISTVNLAHGLAGGSSVDLQADVSTIVENINEKATAHQDAAVALLSKTEKPSIVQLKKLGGWKLSWRQYVKKGKLYGEVNNVEGPDDSVQAVWSGKLRSATTVEFTVSTSVDNAKNGTATDNLTTYSYAVVGRIPPTDKQLSEAETKYEKKMVESNADSIVMFTSGDDDARAVMLKEQGDGKYSDGRSASSGLVDTVRPMRGELAG